MSEHIEHPASRRPFRIGRRGDLAFIGAGLLALGGAAGAAVMAETRPSASMAPAIPVAIRSLSSGGVVTIRGRVVEIYGDKFIMADASGRALVDTGPEGDDRRLVTTGEPVTVQGRFERGFVHAAFLVGPDNKVSALGPLGGPPRGPRGPRGGPDDGPGAPPLPPLGVGPAGIAPPSSPPGVGAVAKAPPLPATTDGAVAPAPVDSAAQATTGR